MTVTQDDIIWPDPSDGYTIRVVRYPYTVHTDELGCVMGFSFHTGELWTEIPGRDVVKFYIARRKDELK